LLEAATRLAIMVDHPPYGCAHLALAIQRDCQFVTGDERLMRTLRERRRADLQERVIGLHQATEG